MFKSKKTSSIRGFAESLGLVERPKTGWESFKASASAFVAEDKRAISSWSAQDHQRRMDLAVARNSYSLGFAGPAKAERSLAARTIEWGLENPAAAATLLAGAASAVGFGIEWAKERRAAGAPDAEPQAPKAPKA